MIIKNISVYKNCYRYLTATVLYFLSPCLLASPIIPIGNHNNMLYYQMGGASDYRLPPVQHHTAIHLQAGADLGMGHQCGMYNPALSIKNSLNDLQDSASNLTQSLIANATGSIAQMPMYFLAQANPTLYHLLNNTLVNAQTRLAASVKSCQDIKHQIGQNKNPYQDWATLSMGDSWKQHLSLTAKGAEDINQAKDTIEANAGDDGVPWVQGKNSSDGVLHAGGKNQPAIHVIQDSIQAGYNAMLSRELTANQPAPHDTGLAQQFPTPQSGADWITNVLGDQVVTTCNEKSCKNAQAGSAGRGLLSSITVCHAENKDDCIATLHHRLQQLVIGVTPATKENLIAVSANDLVISPQVLQTIRGMDGSQQGIVLNKLAQEIALQRLMDKALTARTLLRTGSQVPVIAANQPAQKQLQQAIGQLDQQIRDIPFEKEVRQQLMSDTLLQTLKYANAQQQQAVGMRVTNPNPLLEQSAIAKGGKP